ncbi:unnamed protein product, partial [Didymodactylos carnosus]
VLELPHPDFSFINTVTLFIFRILLPMMSYLTFICLTFVLFASSTNGVRRHLSKRQTANSYAVRGRVVFAGGYTQIPPGARLNVELQDTSLQDAPAITISRSQLTARQFPINFELPYSTNQIQAYRTYSISARIVGTNDQLLYINDQNIRISFNSNNQRPIIDVPVIQVSQSSDNNQIEFEGKQWPELVGRNGEEAVRIIKQQSGQPITMDYRLDRVRVFVDDRGIVTSVPRTG